MVHDHAARRRLNLLWQAGDDFTSELVRIHETIESEGGPRQPVCLAINRSDYMLHVPEDGVTAPHLLQVSTVPKRFEKNW